MFDAFADLLTSFRRVLLTTHEFPDADGVGSMLGLSSFLTTRGVDVRIVVAPRLPVFLAFLDPESRIESFDPESRHENLSDWPDAWVLVDASEIQRLGKMESAFLASKAPKYCLDHHLNATIESFHMTCIDATASSTAELVFGLVAPRMERPWPLAMATALYAGLADDTGNFRFPSSTGKAHRIAAELIEMGVDPAVVYQSLYHQGRPERLKIFGRAFSAIRLQGDNRYARMTTTRQDMIECEAVHEDLEGLVSKPLELRGVEVSALLNELADGRVKLSLRSRSKVDVNAVCRTFGGGGHRLASGAKLDGPLEEAQNRVDAAILARLQEDLHEA